MNLKRQLAKYLKYRGLTAAELARRSGVSRQVLSQWLGGVEPKRISQVKAVARVLNVSVDHLAFGDGLQDSEVVMDLGKVFGNDWVSGLFEVKLRKVLER